MYSRRILPRLSTTTTSSSTPTAARPFTTASAQWNKYSSTPALSDIAPEQGHLFDAKQKEFRQNLAEQNRKRKEQERQSASIAASSSPAKSSSPHDISSGSAQGLGSLSSVAGEAARQNDGSDKKKGTGRLSSLIYGTEEGREMDREIERSFSQVLARGKYVHSIVFHEVKPDKVDEYVELVGSWYPRMASMPENKVHLVGSWRTEVGDCDTFGMWQTCRYEGDTGTDCAACSPHLGIPALRRLPRIAQLDPEPPRIPCLRRQAKDAHHQQEDFPYARVPFLADFTTTFARWCVRAEVIHAASWQPPRVGDALAEGFGCEERGHGGCGRCVTYDE